MTPHILTLAVFCIFLSFSASAQQNAADSQEWIIRNQQNQIEEERRQREIEAIQKERERLKKEEQQKQEVKVSGQTEKCLPIQQITLHNADSLSKFQQKNLTKEFINQCLNADLLRQLITKITKHYHDSGLVTTQVLLPKQNLQSGLLELNIIEGKIEKLSYGKDGFFEEMQKFTAFGRPEGETLNINEINQGIYQINRLSSNAATMKIEPGSADGLSKIIIENKRKFPAKFSIGRDNLGNKFTGIQRTIFSSNFDNFLSLNDNINLSLTKNLHDNNLYKDLNSFSSSISIPFKAYSFSYSFFRSEYRGTNIGNNSLIINEGFSQQNKVGIDRLLLNQNDLRISANSSLTNKSAASYQNDVKVANQHRKITLLDFGFSASKFFANGINLYLKPSYVRGITALNATKDSKSRLNQKAQYEAYKLYASTSKKFTLPKINKPLIFSSEMDSQLSQNTLYGSEQFAIGGYYSVRGFRENYISADSGYYVRNKLSFSPGYNLTFEPFYDYGYAKFKHDYGIGGRLSRGGIKAIFAHNYFNASVTYGKVLSRSRLSLQSSDQKEDQMVYFELSASCC